MNAKKHPIDFDALRKGDVVAAEVIEEAMGISVTEEQYRLAQMSLRDQIQRERPDLIARMRGKNIHVCTDEEADDYTWSSVEKAVRRIGRNAQLRGRIVRADFDDSRRRAAQTRDQAGTMLAIDSAKRTRKANRDARLAAANDDGSRTRQLEEPAE